MSEALKNVIFFSESSYGGDILAISDWGQSVGFYDMEGNMVSVQLI